MSKPNRWIAVALFATGLFTRTAHAADAPAFRPPAVPLVVSDPYLSIWSEADHLTDDNPRHWTRKEQTLTSMIRIDGKPYRLMGKSPADIPAFPQVGVQVLPTRTIYDFEDSQTHIKLTFTTAAIPNDLKLLSRPVTYIDWEIRSLDGQKHMADVYIAASGQLVVHSPDQRVVSSEHRSVMRALRIGTVDQPLLSRQGDDTRIDWGHLYLAMENVYISTGQGPAEKLVKEFISKGSLSTNDGATPHAVKDGNPSIAFACPRPFGDKAAHVNAIIGYDEIYAIKYFGRPLRPYWAKDDPGYMSMLDDAYDDQFEAAKKCDKFDEELMADARKIGGERYAQIIALSYRQTLAGCGLAADAKGQPLLFTKENTSNGDIATVDVIFPMEPIFILLSPTLAKASLVSVLDYAASPHWKFPNAPHDLGTYPVVTGRDDGGEGMPVEESGNMLILCDAIAHAEGNPEFVAKYWPQLTQWAEYLEQYGLDPENQLCTDDFMGHLAHNANLSVKAILGLAAYGDLCRMRGDNAAAEKYFKLARVDAEHWVKVAAEGDHFRLAFDKPNTWSQKYNLVWDKLLGLNVFPPEVARKEVAFYKTVMQKYGVPLDSRTKLTKTDWSIWCATMAETPADFETIVSPIYDYLNETTTRDPLADSYETDKVKSGGMHARPVMGGAFIKMLSDEAIWKKWASADKQKVGPWASLPKPPIVTEVLPTAQPQPIWKYTFEKPGDGWNKPGFDAKKWREGPAGFGTRGTPGAIVSTEWKTADIWLRREITVPDGKHPNLQFLVYHDEDVEIYVDGVLGASEAGFINSYMPMTISATARALLKPGAKVLLAVHCHQTEGGQGVDVGLADVVPSEP